MTDRSPSIAVIAAGPRRGSHCNRIASFAAHRLARDGLDVALVITHLLPAAALLGGERTEPSIAAALRQVRSADAVILASPIAHGAFGASLKAWLGLLRPGELQDKSVLPIATGPTGGDTLAFSCALGPVLVVLGVPEPRPTLFVADAWIGDDHGGDASRTGGGELALHEVVRARVERALDGLARSVVPARRRSGSAP